jgi:hypothetical protein
MPQDEGRAQAEGDEENQGDGRQAVVGDEFSLPRGVQAFGAVTARVEETMLEGPVLGEIHPVVRQKVAVARFAQSVDSLTLGEVYDQALARQCVDSVVKGFCES